MHVKRRKNILKKVKGFRGGRKNLIKLAKTAATKAGEHAFGDRRRKKSEFRQVWQVRLGAAAREAGTSYSKLIGALKKAGVALDRKVLSELAAKESATFKKLMDSLKK
jgi:large subunit ribosomal protein L20